MEVNEPAVKYTILKGMNPLEFIEWESTQPEKNEYIAGSIYAMAGASINHNTIQSNLIGTIHPFLKGKDCNIYASDLRVFVKSKEAFFYPDATIVCGEIELAEEFKETVKNPSVVFEILSPSTEHYDMGKKFFNYMQIDTLKETIAIDSREMNIKIGRRKANNLWAFEELTQANQIFAIETIQFSMSVQDIYNQVKLSSTPGENQTSNA